MTCKAMIYMHVCMYISLIMHANTYVYAHICTYIYVLCTFVNMFTYFLMTPLLMKLRYIYQEAIHT